MKPEEVKVRNWLNRVFYADKKIRTLDMLLKASVMHAEGLSRVQQYSCTGKSDTRLNSTQDAFLKLADIEYRYNLQKQELLEIYDEVSEAISRLHDDELEAVLIHRFLLFHTIQQTADLMNYSPETVKRKQRKAIQKLTLYDLV